MASIPDVLIWNIPVIAAVPQQWFSSVPHRCRHLSVPMHMYIWRKLNNRRCWSTTNFWSPLGPPNHWMLIHSLACLWSIFSATPFHDFSKTLKAQLLLPSFPFLLFFWVGSNSWTARLSCKTHESIGRRGLQGRGQGESSWWSGLNTCKKCFDGAHGQISRKQAPHR